ncbi:hypothetical protein SLEP1_g19992 [Rubroshorea leprosula]|uniref:Uncharacterized protein n=1 Tax=Rubroshorea leprosula TaxID=152421 RepID=A0AAV5J4J4_9ROSI|nr:hypothetical protein SLEP1_g19992 [Rubroshorea leprosula]
MSIRQRWLLVFCFPKQLWFLLWVVKGIREMQQWGHPELMLVGCFLGLRSLL